MPHFGRRQRTRHAADEKWPLQPVNAARLCVRQLLLLGITLLAARPYMHTASLTQEAMLPAIRQFLVRFMPPTLALHLLGACLGSAAKSEHGTAEAALPALGRRALTIAAAAPIGAAIYAWGAMVFGISLVHQSSTTAHWAVLMTALTVVPAAAVAAGDTVRWRRIFLLWRALGEDELSVAAPALAALIGTWFGAWPMPLDWGTAWQAWPVCCAVGAFVGYCVGTVAAIPLGVSQSRAWRESRDALQHAQT